MTQTTRDIRVEFRGVSKHFGTLEVVRDVTFSIAEGDFVALVGPSGCGKTTMMNMSCWKAARSRSPALTAA
jgi:ABC-type Fe3+/spermidine/putrescine transport system ATPase subunit